MQKAIINTIHANISIASPLIMNNTFKIWRSNSWRSVIWIQTVFKYDQQIYIIPKTCVIFYLQINVTASQRDIYWHHSGMCLLGTNNCFFYLSERKLGLVMVILWKEYHWNYINPKKNSKLVTGRGAGEINCLQMFMARDFLRLRCTDIFFLQ